MLNMGTRLENLVSFPIFAVNEINKCIYKQPFRPFNAGSNHASSTACTYP